MVRLPFIGKISQRILQLLGISKSLSLPIQGERHLTQNQNIVTMTTLTLQFSNKIEVWNVTLLLKYEIFLGVHRLLKSHVTAINSISSEMCYKLQIISDSKQTNVTMWFDLIYSLCGKWFIDFTISIWITQEWYSLSRFL